jgi:hypothetical protein
MIALALPVLWSCAIDDGVSPVNTAAPRFYLARDLPLVYDAENTGANCDHRPLFAQSPI